MKKQLPETLLPCPFCGGEAVVGEGLSGGSLGNAHYYFVNCTECLSSNSMGADAQVWSREYAIEHWNMRISETKYFQSPLLKLEWE
jgi:Lar family restriction alleviation protein